MRWPLITRRHHQRQVEALRDFYTAKIDVSRTQYQAAVDAEYTRALREGKAQLHRMAVDMTYEVFMGQNIQWRAFLQELEGMFKPQKTDLPPVIGDTSE